MPNGNPKFHEEELPALEAFFSKIAGVLTQFAARHNLMLVKYYHQVPSWRFNFRHPKGGVATIDVMKETDDSAKIHSYWWLNDYDRFTHFSKLGEPELFNTGEANLDSLLENKLREILSWELGEWTQVATGYEDYWKSYGRDFIEKDVERYPEPKL
ncbi:MAG: hypothetical protein ICV60_07625 [Pyrinomonadaceae bacterium]|nr:hypothetical protein [Pyrinomonadaceae bacterium]